MTKNRTRTPVYLDPGMHPGLEVKGLTVYILSKQSLPLNFAGQYKLIDVFLITHTLNCQIIVWLFINCAFGPAYIYVSKKLHAKCNANEIEKIFCSR